MIHGTCAECKQVYEVVDGKLVKHYYGVGYCRGSEYPPADVKLNDPVDHPKHYTSHPSGVECIDITEHMTFSAGNAVKYLWRAGLKGKDAADARAKHIEDLKKAAWYVAREIARLEKAK